MKITQRSPNFFSGFESVKAEAFSLDELMKIPFIKQWVDKKNFYRLSLGSHDHVEAILMVELNEGKEFWAIAYLREFKEFNLPIWKKPANNQV